MKVKTAFKLIAGIALIAVGYTGGVYIGIPFTDKSKLAGNISMAADNEDPDILAMREVLAEDPQSQKQSIISTALLSSRIDVLDSLVDNGIKVTKDQKELEDIYKYFSSLKRKTSAAKENFKALIATNQKVINGDEVPNFGEISNRALLSFFVLDNALSNDKAGDMLDYSLQLNNEKASDAIAGWIAYCSDEALLKGDNEDVAMWTKVYASLSDAQKQSFQQSKNSISNSLNAALAKADADNEDVDISNAINAIQVSGVNANTLFGTKSNNALTAAVNYGCNQAIPAKHSK